MADKPAAKDPDPEPRAEAEAGVTMRTQFPVDRFEHGVKGAPPITRAGTHIASSSLAAQIRSRAAESGVALEEEN